MKIGRNEKCPCGSNKKYKKCCLYKVNTGSAIITSPRDFVQDRQIPFRKARLVLKIGNDYKSIFLLTTTKDKSLIIDPSAYSNFGNWRIAYYTIPPAPVKNIDISPDKDSLIMCNDIGPKFTYHRSGWVVAGKTGRIDGLRIKATPLPDVDGHLFTIMAQGFEGFQNTDINDKSYVNFFPYIPQELYTLKIVGYMGTLESLTFDKKLLIPKDEKNIRMAIERDGQKIEIIFIKIPFEDGTIKWLKLEIWPNHIPLKVKGPSLNAIFGWDQIKAHVKNEKVQMIGIMGGGDM